LGGDCLADIFISYARSDVALANRLAAALEAHGQSVWIDQKIEGGTQFSEVIEREIAASRKVVVLWTPASVKSEWVRDEASIAKEQGKFVPVTIDGTMPPIGFRQTQTTPIDDWASGNASDLPSAMLAALSLNPDEAVPPAEAQAISLNKPRFIFAAIGAVVLVLAGVLYLTMGRDSDGASLAQGERIAVVVKPFAASAGAEPAEMGLAQGITDELVIRLRAAPELRIATSDPAGNVPGDSFAGAYLVEGNIRVQGETLRATATLKGSDGEILWTDNFERPMQDIFYVQEDIATSIAGVLRVSFDIGPDSASYEGTNDPEAFSVFMQGLQSQNGGDFTVTASLFERAVELDPDFGRAAGLLETALAIQLVGVPLRDQDQADALIERISEIAEQSIERAPDVFVSQTNGIQMALAKKDFAAMTRYARSAREIGYPESLAVFSQYGLYPMAMGRSDELAELMRRSALIEPNLVNIQFFVWPPILYRDYDTVIESFDRMVRQGQTIGSFSDAVVWAHWLSGDRDRAMEIARQYFPAAAQRIEAAAAGSPQASMSMEELRTWLTSQMGVGGQGLAMEYATAEAALGNNAAAMRLIRLSMERPGGNLVFMLWHPIFDDVRTMPEFVELIEEMGMVDAWRESGEWSDWCRPVGEDGVECS